MAKSSKTEWADRSTATPVTVAENVREFLIENGRLAERSGDDVADLKQYLWAAMEGVHAFIANVQSSAPELRALASQAAVDLKTISAIAPASLNWCSEERHSKPH